MDVAHEHDATPGTQDSDRRRPLPLRVYMWLLVAIAVGAAVVAVIYQRAVAADDATVAARRDSQFGADVAVRQIAAEIALVQTNVGATAGAPALVDVLTATGSPCQLAFSGPGAFSAGRLDVIRSDGSVACSSSTSGAAFTYPTDTWLQHAFAAPTLDGPVIDPQTNKSALVVSAPVGDLGAVVALLDLEVLAPGLNASLGGPRSLEFVVTDPDAGVVVSRSTSDTRGDLDGVTRIYGSAPVPGLGWTVSAGADKSDALATARRLSNRQALVTLCGVVLMLALLFVVHRRIVRPVRRLSTEVRAASRQPGQGHFTVDGPREIADLVGDVNGLVDAVVRDITVRKQAEAERAELEDRVRQSQRLESVGQLAGGIAHDFNNLLSVITNYAAFVGARTTDQPDIQHDLGQVQAASERAARLTRQLLTVARRQVVEVETLDLNQVVSDITTMLSRTIGASIVLEMRLANEPLIVECDRGQIEQVVLNLAVNARDAMPAGGALTIETRLVHLDEHYARTHPDVSAGAYAQLAVSDTGTGMSREVASKIFEPFFTTKPLGEGTGLGLATVYGIVKASHGTIAVYSEEGIGTTFRVYFPEQIDATVAPAPIETPRAQGRGELILVVEDEPAVLELTTRILREDGYAVLEAATYEEALQHAQATAFHLLLTDSVMPHMSGRRLAEQIHELRPGTPVIYMSGYSDGVVASAGLVEPGTAIIQKPFDRHTLIDRVQRVLASADDS